MAKVEIKDFNVILEGVDSCGKTSVAKEIARLWGFTFIDTDWHNLDYKRATGLDTRPYFDGLNLATAQFLKSAKGLIKPRYSLSEAVYSKYYKRGSLLTQEEMESVIITKGIVFYIDIDYDKYCEIHKTRSIEPPMDKHMFEDQQGLFYQAFENCKVYHKYRIFNNSTYERLVSIVGYRLDVIQNSSER